MFKIKKKNVQPGCTPQASSLLDMQLTTSQPSQVSLSCTKLRLLPLKFEAQFVLRGTLDPQLLEKCDNIF